MSTLLSSKGAGESITPDQFIHLILYNNAIATFQSFLCAHGAVKRLFSVIVEMTTINSVIKKPLSTCYV